LRAVREAAARALGDIGGTRGVSALIAALRDPRGSVRESAVAALAAIGGNVAVRALVEVSMADRDPWVREEAAAALEETTEP
jgi:HEAT repeat protein